MEEKIKIYSDENIFLGEETRSVVHKGGWWHYVFHCWVYERSTDRIVLQQRASNKALFAEMFDVSCAGHYSSDEELDSTKELMEELGIIVDYSKLIYMFDFRDVFIKDDICDREIARVHLLIVDEFDPAPTIPDEIKSIITCKWDDVIKLVDKEMYEIESEHRFGIKDTSDIKLAMLVPRNDGYYNKVIRSIKELL